MNNEISTDMLSRRHFLKTTMFGTAGLVIGPSMLWSNHSAAEDGTSTLVIARNEESSTFDPILTALNSDAWVLDNMNANLVRITHDGTALEPDLAESWEVDESGKRYTFRLRSNVKFHNGRLIETEDVKFSLERVRDQNDSVFANMYQLIEEVNPLDGRHIEIILNKVYAPFLSAVAMFPAAIVPRDVVEERDDEFGSQPVGAGAFELEEWKRDDRVTLVRNANYWESNRVSLDRISWRFIPNDNTRIMSLSSHESNAAINIPFNRINEVSAKPGIDMHLDPSSREDFMIINHSKKPLDDVRVRRALFMGLNREALIKVVLFGHGKVSNSFIPAGGLFHNPDNKDYPYDPDKAKELLEEAGATDLSLNLLINSGNSVNNQIAILMQQMYKDIGIKLNIDKREHGERWNSLQAGEYELSLAYWVNDIIDPDQKATFSLYGYNDSRAYFTEYKNPKVKQLIEEGRQTLDKERRKEIYFELQRIAMEDVVYINLYYSPFRNASRDTVVGFYQNPTGRFMLEDTSIKSE
jgi:peptide/nickel transport system substrate-binding protein